MAAHVPRIHIAGALAVGDTLSLPDVKRHHLTTVLRLSAGATIQLFNDSDTEYTARIETATRKIADVTVVARATPTRESPLDITLVQAIARGDRMDYALTKAVELGVSRIQPVFTDNAKVRLEGDRLAKKHAHWQNVVEAAAEQSGRLIRPAVAPPCGLADRLVAAASGRSRLVFAPADAEPLAAGAVGAVIDLLIGPESGLSAREIEAARDGGWRPVTLGPRTLRTETAGPAAIAALQTLSGDFAGKTS